MRVYKQVTKQGFIAKNEDDTIVFFESDDLSETSFNYPTENELEGCYKLDDDSEGEPLQILDGTELGESMRFGDAAMAVEIVIRGF